MQKKGEGANRHHEYQTWIYLKALNIEEGSIVYVSKDDLAILEYPVKKSDTLLENEVTFIASLLNTAWKEKNPGLLPLPEKADWQAKYCSYHKKCIKL